MPKLGSSKLHTQRSGNAVVELVLHRHVIHIGIFRSRNDRHTLGHVRMVYVEVRLRLLTETEAYLRTYLEVGLQTATLPTPP